MKSGWLIRFVLITAVACGLAAAPAMAAPEGEHKADAVKKEGDKTGDHKEEKDKTGFMGLKRYDLGIATLIVFGLLFVILGKFAWKPIMAGLEKREELITAARTNAEKAREDAEKLLLEVKAQRARGNEEVVALLAEARRDADNFREAERARASADIQADRERLKREIDTARDQALKELWEKTVQLAALVSSKALGRVVSPDDHRRLVDDALVELQQEINLRKKA
jgi:F-type H+-transporting ATPase subunit b